MAGKRKYAEVIRMSMKTKNNPTGHEVTIRQLGRETGYSYEHVRKITKGEPFASRELNDAICQFLGMDPEEMWKIAQNEKLEWKYGTGIVTALPNNARLVSAWEHLNDNDRDRVIQVAEALAFANRTAGGPPGS